MPDYTGRWLPGTALGGNGSTLCERRRSQALDPIQELWCSLLMLLVCRVSFDMQLLDLNKGLHCLVSILSPLYIWRLRHHNDRL